MSARGIDRDILTADSAKASDTLKSARRLLEELPGGARTIYTLIALTLGEVAVQVIVALAARQLLITVSAPAQLTSAPAQGFPVRTTVVAALATIATFVVVRARHRRQEALAVAAREQAVDRLSRHLHDADIEDLTATPMAGLREVLMTDIDFAYRFLLESVSQLTVLVAWVVAAIAITAWLSPPLLAVLVIMGLVVALAVIQSSRRHLALTLQRFARLSAVSQRARDVVEVERVIVARQFGLGDLFVRRFLGAHSEFAETARAQGAITASLRAVISSLGALVLLAVVLTGGLLVVRSGLEIGSLVAILFVLGQLLAAVAALGDYAAGLAETATAGRRLMAFWDNPNASAPLAPREADDSIAALEAEGLGFAYAGEPATLTRVNLRLERGKPAALTAATGAGKSTLAMLLAGVLTPGEGDVRILGGAEHARTTAEIHPGRILYVGSKPVLVAGSMLDNLLLDSDPDSESASTVEHGEAELAEISEFLTRVTAGMLPFGITEDVVGPNGTGLSSGQAQLVQLARAIHRNPDVIILDEATSSLDIATEEAVQRQLLDWCRDRITLVISHRACPWTDFAQDQWGLVEVLGSPALTIADREAVR